MENTTKNLFDSMVETQNKTMNNWMETTQKMQKAVMGGASVEKGSDLYKEWINNQMNILTNATDEFKNKAAETTQNTNFNSQEFYKNWYSNQMNMVKQMMDTNQNLYNSFLNYGKPTSDVNENFTKMNETLTGLYNNWQNTLNSTFNNLMQNIPGTNQNTFKDMFNGINLYSKMQDIMTPWMKSLSTGNFNADSLKNMMDPAKVKEITEKLFESFFHYPNMKDMIDTYTKNYETYFHNNSNLSKEYMENLRNTFGHLPLLAGGDFAKLSGIYNQFNSMLQTTYGPVMRLIAQSPEKRNVEINIELTDKIAQFSLKQAQLQYLLYTSAQTATERTVEFFTDKVKNGAEINSFQTVFGEWVSLTERVYLDLFNSEEYSKLKGELLADGMAAKKLVEKQYEHLFENTPFIFRSEMDELYKTIHDLKKKVRDLEGRLAVNNASTTELEEDKISKTAKKK
jgi:hypothetical protein